MKLIFGDYYAAKNWEIAKAIGIPERFLYCSANRFIPNLDRMMGLIREPCRLSARDIFEMQRQGVQEQRERGSQNTFITWTQYYGN